MVYKVPDAYLEEYAERLKELFDLTVTKAQLSKFLSAEGISHKKVLFSLLATNRSFKRKPENEIQS